jgi:hypothetical protein
MLTVETIIQLTKLMALVLAPEVPDVLPPCPPAVVGQLAVKIEKELLPPTEPFWPTVESVVIEAPPAPPAPTVTVSVAPKRERGIIASTIPPTLPPAPPVLTAETACLVPDPPPAPPAKMRTQAMVLPEGLVHVAVPAVVNV